jgi:hypothetical protein
MRQFRSSNEMIKVKTHVRVTREAQPILVGVLNNGCLVIMVGNIISIIILYRCNVIPSVALCGNYMKKKMYFHHPVWPISFLFSFSNIFFLFPVALLYEL